jgi:hypothetical protein
LCQKRLRPRAFNKFDEQVKSLRRTITNAKKKGADEISPTSQDDYKADLKEALLERKASEGCLTETAEGFFSQGYWFQRCPSP